MSLSFPPFTIVDGDIKPCFPSASSLDTRVQHREEPGERGSRALRRETAAALLVDKEGSQRRKQQRALEKL